MAGASPVAASGGEAVFGLRPGLAGHTTLTGGHFTYSLPAGGRMTDRLQAVNFSSNAITLDMYRANLDMSGSGGTGPGQPADPPVGATSWIRLARSTLVMPPGTALTDPFTVAVPPHTPPGDYLSALVGSLAGGPVTPGGLTEQARVALIVKVTVAGTVRTALSAGPLVHHRRGGAEQFEVTVENQGNVVVDLAGTLSLPGHTTTALDPQGLYVIPGGHATLTADWRHLPSLSDATATARITATLDGHQVASFTRRASILFVPWRLVGGGAALVILLVPMSLLGRSRLRSWRRRRREDRAILAAYRTSGSIPLVEPD